MARMVVIFRTPKNVAAFDRHYFEIHGGEMADGRLYRS